MRAIVIATGHTPDPLFMQERMPLPLLPLVDRPFIQHVVEYLIEQGMTQFDFILSHLPEKIEAFLGDGTRWGSTFTFHLAREASQPYRLLKPICQSDTESPFLLVHADRLPSIPLAQDVSWQPQTPLDQPIIYYWRDTDTTPHQASNQWTGWAWLTPQHVADLPDHHEEPEMSAYLLNRAASEGTWVALPRPLSMTSYQDVLDAHETVLTAQEMNIFLTGKKVEDGIWLSRNVSLHPTAQLTPPVYIGENSQVGRGVQLGPVAVVGKDCVLDSRCMLTNTVVYAGSYVGEALELQDVIVDKNRLINVRFGVEVPIADDFLLGSMSSRQVRLWLLKPLSQGLAFTLLPFVAPMLIATALWLKLTRSGPVIYRKPVVALPAPKESERWRTFDLLSFSADPPKFTSPLRQFFLHFLPAWINIVKGDLHFVGVQPRTPTETEALSQDWKAIYLQGKVGFITEADINYGNQPNEDELYTAEAYYTVTASIRHDLKLCSKYLGRMLGFRNSNLAT